MFLFPFSILSLNIQVKFKSILIFWERGHKCFTNISCLFGWVWCICCSTSVDDISVINRCSGVQKRKVDLPSGSYAIDNILFGPRGKMTFHFTKWNKYWIALPYTPVCTRGIWKVLQFIHVILYSVYRKHAETCPPPPGLKWTFDETARDMVDETAGGKEH